MKIKIIAVLLFIFLMVSISCNLPFAISPVEPTETKERRLNATRIAETIMADLATGTAAAVPVATLTSTPTIPPAAATRTSQPPEVAAPPANTPTSTQVELPCNQAVFLADVTIPDGTDIQTGTGFTKTWRLQNSGSCAWNSNYHAVFESGARMGAPDAVAVTGGTVPNGGWVDITVNLTAPAAPGTYRGNFRLRSPDGVLFGVGSGAPFYVEIDAVAPAGEEEPAPEEEEPEPEVVQLPDLIITKITLNPANPTKGDPVTITVQTKNQGNAVSGPYTVKWWAGENYAAPACSWNVDNSNPNGGRVLSCVYAGYPSWYPSLWTKAVIDPAGGVAESNEGNNTLRKEIQVGH